MITTFTNNRGTFVVERHPGRPPKVLAGPMAAGSAKDFARRLRTKLDKNRRQPDGQG